MSLVVTRIEVRNIRSIEHAVIDLDPEGITALVGSIGSGKSTVLEMVAWACWGTTPPGVSQCDLRRLGADALPCSAEITMSIDGIEVRAVRTLTRKVAKDGTASEAAGARLLIAGVAVEQITPSKLTAKMTELTGLSGRMFRSMQFIGQAQLPRLAQGTASEIQSLIEELTGVAPLTKSIERASKTAAAAEQSARALPGDPDVLAQHEAELTDLRRRSAAASEADFAALMDMSRATDEAARALARKQQLDTRAAAADDAAQTIERAERRLAAETDRLAVLRSRLEAAGGQQVDRVALGSRARNLTDALDEHRAAASRVAAAHRVVELGRASAESSAAAAAALPDVAPELTQATADARSLADRLSAASSAGDTARSQADLVRATTHDADCPTCGQHVADPESLARTLDAAADALDDQAKALSGQLHDMDARVAALRSADSQRNREAYNAETQQAALDGCIAEADARDATLQAAIAGLLALLPGSTAETGPQDAAAALLDATDRLRAADAVEQLMSDIALAEGVVEGAREEIGRCAPASQGRPAAAEMDAAAAALLSAGQAEAAAAERQRELAIATAQMTGQAQRVEAVRDAEAVRVGAKRAALLAAEIARASASLLGALRKDMLADYTEGIADSASDLLSSLGCEHIAISLDETFLPRVVRADGSSLPLSQLSGGEQYRAAMCLRLGITAQIAGGGALPMVFGDEITAAYDAATREQVVAFLASLGMPMALVGHTDEVLAISSRSYTFAKPDDGSGSTARLNGAAGSRQPATTAAAA